MTIHFDDSTSITSGGSLGKLLQIRRVERTAVRASAHNGSSWAEAAESQFRVPITPSASGNTIIVWCSISYACGNGTLGGMVPVYYDTTNNNAVAMAGYCPSGGSFGAPANVLSNNSWFHEDMRNNSGNTQWFTVIKIGYHQTTNTNAASIRLYSRNYSGTFSLGDNQQACSMTVVELEGTI